MPRIWSRLRITHFLDTYTHVRLRAFILFITITRICDCSVCTARATCARELGITQDSGGSHCPGFDDACSLQRCGVRLCPVSWSIRRGQNRFASYRGSRGAFNRTQCDATAAREPPRNRAMQTRVERNTKAHPDWDSKMRTSNEGFDQGLSHVVCIRMEHAVCAHPPADCL